MPTVCLLVPTSKRLAPLVSQALFAAGAGGLEERSGRSTTLVAYGTTRAELAAVWKRAEVILRGELPQRDVPEPRIEIDRDERWRTAWTEHLRPVELTRRVLLAPTSQVPERVGADRRLLLYQPALAFGDGGHATTRLAARAIEAHYAKAPGGALLDLGTGSGVLSLVAVVSGARRALGTDIDEEALRAAETNAALNGLSRSTRFVAAGARLTGSFDLTVINIELRPLLQLLATLPTVARRAPRLLVTGFLASQLDPVKRALSAVGFRPGARRSEGDWCLLSAAPRRPE